MVRQYRDDDRGKCPAGSAWWEENIQPMLIRAAIAALDRPATVQGEVRYHFTDAHTFAVTTAEGERLYQMMIP